MVPGPLTTALWKRPSVVGLRAVLRDVFRGRHDRNEFFGCLLGRGWEGLRDLRWEVGAHRHHGLIDGKSTALGPKTAVHLVMVQDVFL